MRGRCARWDATGVQLTLSSETDGNQIRPSALQRWVGSWLRVHMARFAPAVKRPNSLAEVFDAAWVVVGRRSYTLHHDEIDQLRLDLALCIGRMVVTGVTDTRDLVRRSILHFLH